MKNIMSKIYLELLDKQKRNIFNKLSSFGKKGYLAGGTALALQLKHRISEDFDIFVNGIIDNKLHLEIKKIFGKVRYYVNTSDQVSFETKEKVKITFLWYYFKTLNSLITTDSLSLASIEDIATDKAHTIGRRAVWRDYVDIFYLLKEKIINIEKIIYLAKKKFGHEFVEIQFLEQLRYFDDLKTIPIVFINNKYSEREIKLFLTQSVETYLKKVLHL